MKKTILHGLLTALCLLSFTGFVTIFSLGAMNYNAARQDVAHKSFATDQEIEDCLKQHGFNLAWHENPSPIDLIKSGVKTFK